MKQKLGLMVVVMTLLVNSGCQKNADGGSSQQTKTELITKSAWKYDHAGLDLDNDGTIDSPVPGGIIQPCDVDGTLTFNANGTGVGDEGATKCNAANPQTSNFNWSLKNNETIIAFSNVVFGGLTGDVKLISVTESQLTLEKEVTNLGFTVNVVVVLKH
jgi:hypothetical protein